MLSTQQVEQTAPVTPPRRQWRDDRGVATLEQLGVVVVAALLVIAGTLGVANYGPHLSSRLCELADGMGLSPGVCESPGDGSGEQPVASEDEGPKHEDFQPPVCTLQTDTEKHSGKLKVAFVTFGSDSGFAVTEKSDGTVSVTVTDGSSLGLEGGFGANVGKDAKDVALGANVKFGGELTYAAGDTWKFESMAEWEAMEKQLNDYLSHKKAMRGGGIIGPVGPSLRKPPKPDDPTVTTSTFGINASVSAQGGFRIQDGTKSDGKPKWFSPNLGVYGSGKLSDSVTTTTDHESGEISETFTFEASGEIGADAIIANAGAAGEHKDAYKVTRNKEGEVTEIEFMRESSGGSGTEIALDSSVLSGSDTKGSAKVGRKDKQRTVTTTELTVTDENRATVDEWIHSNITAAKNGEPAYYPGNAYTPTEPIEGDPLATLLHKDAMSSLRVYDNVEDGWSYAAEFAVGFKLGGSIGKKNTESTVSDAWFLGAPDTEGQRSYIPDEACVR